MRSIRTMLLLALTAVAAAAFIAPAVASASNWTKEGKEISGVHWVQEGVPMEGKEGSFALNGNLYWGGGLGSVTCPVSAEFHISPGDAGVVTKFDVSAAGCGKVGGTIGTVCSKVSSVTASGLPLWNITATGPDSKPTISIKEVSLTYTFTGGECDKTPLVVPFTGAFTATPDKSEAIGSVALTGYLGFGANKVSVAGTTLNVTPAGKYGISGKRFAAVSGELGWAGSLGTMSCPVSGTVALSPGSEGKLNSLTFDGSKCFFTGWIATCGIKSVGPPQTLTLVDQGSSIAVKGFAIGVGTPQCGFAYAFEGELQATPDKTNSISYTTLKGTLKSGVVNVGWSGKLNWSPAGVYGL